MSLEHSFASGSYSGTAATKSISLGFQPFAVLIMNLANGDLSFKSREFSSDTYITYPGGPAVNTGLTITSDGFDLNADAEINSSGDTIYYAAWDEATNVAYSESYTGDGTTLQAIVTGKPGIHCFTSLDANDERMFWGNRSIKTMWGQLNNGNWSRAVDSVDWGTDSVGVTDGTLNEDTIPFEYAGFNALGNTAGPSPDYGAMNNSFGWWGLYTGNGGTLTIDLDEECKFVSVWKDAADPMAFAVDDMPSGDWGRCRLKQFTHQTSGLTFVAGGFQVTGSDLNANNDTYYYWCWFR